MFFGADCIEVFSVGSCTELTKHCLLLHGVSASGTSVVLGVPARGRPGARVHPRRNGACGPGLRDTRCDSRDWLRAGGSRAETLTHHGLTRGSVTSSRFLCLKVEAILSTGCAVGCRSHSVWLICPCRLEGSLSIMAIIFYYFTTVFSSNGQTSKKLKENVVP